MKKNILLYSVILAASNGVLAGELKTKDIDIILSGGVTAGAFATTNAKNNDSQGLAINDVLFELSSDKETEKALNFSAGFGNLSMTTIMEANASKGVGGKNTDENGETNYSTGLQYASLTYQPSNDFWIEAGLLPTKVGYESIQSYNNRNITLGLLWISQPTVNRGARANYALGNMDIYLEFSEPKSFATGVSGKVSIAEYSISYFDEEDGRNIMDLTIHANVSGVKFGFNTNYISLDNRASELGNTAAGLAMYIVPSVSKVDLPIRVEYVRDGTSGLYGGFDSGYSVTVTPTYNISQNGFFRTEFSMLASSNKIFHDSDGAENVEDSVASVAFQLGYQF